MSFSQLRLKIILFMRHASGNDHKALDLETTLKLTIYLLYSVLSFRAHFCFKILYVQNISGIALTDLNIMFQSINRTNLVVTDEIRLNQRRLGYLTLYLFFSMRSYLI